MLVLCYCWRSFFFPLWAASLAEGNLVRWSWPRCCCTGVHPPLPFADIYAFAWSLLKELPLFRQQVGWHLPTSSNLCVCACRLVVPKRCESSCVAHTVSGVAVAVLTVLYRCNFFSSKNDSTKLRSGCIHAIMLRLSELGWMSQSLPLVWRWMACNDLETSGNNRQENEQIYAAAWAQQWLKIKQSFCWLVVVVIVSTQPTPTTSPTVH